MRRVPKFFLAIFSLCALGAGPAQAARFSGNYLLELCGSDAQGHELVAGGHAACQSYVAGLVDYNNLIRSLGTAPSVDFCVPEGTDLNKLQNIVASYLLRNKNQNGSFTAAPAVALALYEAYPCKKRR